MADQVLRQKDRTVLVCSLANSLNQRLKVTPAVWTATVSGKWHSNRIWAIVRFYKDWAHIKYRANNVRI